MHYVSQIPCRYLINRLKKRLCLHMICNHGEIMKED